MRTLNPPTGFIFEGPDLQVQFVDTAKAPTLDGDYNVTAYRMRVDRVETTLMPLAPLPSAQLSVSLAQYKVDGVEYLKQLTLSDALKLINPDCRIAIFAKLPEEVVGAGAMREYLFDGYPSVQEVTFNDDDMSLVIHCVPLVHQLGEERKSQILGRYLTPDLLLPTGNRDPRFVESMPAVFNHKGKPNRCGGTLPLIDVGTGVPVSCPVFTYDGDPNAKYWTYADVLYYLMVMYYQRPLGTGYPLDCSQLMQMSSGRIGLSAPIQLTNPNNPTWADALAAQCEELIVTGRSLVEALTMWCQYCGATMQQFTVDNGGAPRTRLLISLNGDGGPWRDFGTDDAERNIRSAHTDPNMSAASLSLEQGTTMRGRSAQKVANANYIKDGRILQDVANCKSTCQVTGLTPELYEVTLGKCTTALTDPNVFKPGWLPDTTFGDNGAFNLTDIQAISTTENGSELSGNAATMYSRYVRGPDDALAAPYASVGRLWVLNEAGEYTPSLATYYRTAPQDVWDYPKYNLPYDFNLSASCPLAFDQATNLRTQRWFPRRRRMLALISKQPDGLGDMRVPPIVMCSFDSGATWSEFPGSVRFARDQCALIFTDANLAKIKDPSGATTLNVWSATVTGVFRVAVTCCVEGDNYCLSKSDPAAPISQLSHHKILVYPDDFKYESRTGANSDHKATAGWTGSDVDDTLKAKGLANRFIAIAQRKSFSINFSIPWIDRDWLPGDLCDGLSPIGATFRSTTGVYDRWPQVIKVTWVNSDKGQATQLVFDDRRTDPRKEHLEA